MIQDFSGKRVLVTGASRGIGRTLAEDFAARGARVAVNFQRSADLADEVVTGITAAGGNAFAVQADVGVGQQVQGMFDDIEVRMGGMDILVNNAGINRDAPIAEMTEEDWDTVIATNLKGAFLCCRSAVRLMQSEKIDGGRIISISAITSHVGRENAANFCASKGGLDALTRALAVELGPGITVNAIVLGFMNSPLARAVFTKEQIASAQARIPAGRLGEFSEVSALVRYLASGAAAFLTGQAIGLDGGQIIRMP
ncbi:SDR family NAD(P)-dependent oxidoreductase [Sulfitobacter sp. JB4-11]|uniref:SDR family NAD(P)-dependent oxidoreductase n=1 Tax=Sulfitobacter rhodophyticola TaxID=3238304 RepID=UPI0035163081